MSTVGQVLVVGGTGRTGRRVLEQLVARGVRVRALVRSAERLPPGVAGSPLVTVVEGDPLGLPDEALRALLRGCGAVVSCLGHTLSLRGLFGPPRDLVTAAVTRLCRAVEALRPSGPVRVVLMTSVSVNRPGGLDTRRGALERAVVALIRALVPPAADNQRAADFLHRAYGVGHPHVQWAVVRPDSLLEGEVTGYDVHEGLVDGLLRPGASNMANVAHFLCDLATGVEAWERWRGKMPVVVNRVAGGGGHRSGSQTAG